jgi:hypothetical protein
LTVKEIFGAMSMDERFCHATGEMISEETEFREYSKKA